ncbi:hypothetical protein LTR62_005881 [Meristemomyces frigidus]|uniref:Uncharacterized protein n=1 Tax=Meristemomyces frigidus TaxID=1508187 RepID=A0AAN7TQI1_9PEZI|nr:hypothetical protein LTR62_005881 [Meristemomyces frigidus]
MPPLVLADSDDDESEELLDLEPIADEVVNAAAANPRTHDSGSTTTESSVGIEERIRLAAIALMAPTASAVPEVSGGPSPVMALQASQSTKRRHTAAFVATASSSLSSMQTRTKRTKTSPEQKTYSKLQRSSAPRVDDEETGAFARFRADEEEEQDGRRVCDHSAAAAGTPSSLGLPTGSLQRESLDHRLNLLFRESGSTAVDNESSQQRMIERARDGARSVGSTSVVARLVSEDEGKSSPFPWTASQRTPRGRFTQEGRVSALHEGLVVGGEDVEGPEVRGGAPDGGESALVGPAQAAADLRTAGAGQALSSAGMEADQHGGPVKSPRTAQPEPAMPKSSPRVEIALPVAPVTTESASVVQQLELPIQGGKRKAKADPVEDLSSESLADLPPKEMYVPRPSRRRATQMAEEVIDYSLKPEKAARARRTKTAMAAVQERGMLGVFQGSGIATCSPYVEIKASKESTTTVAGAILSEEDINVAVSAHTETVAASSPATISQMNIKAMEHVDDKTFVKPATKPKSTKKARRSHTTIFEDHVDLTPSLRSPSLSQQQAARKKALDDPGPKAIGTREQHHIKKGQDDDESNEMAGKAEPTKEVDVSNASAHNKENAEEQEVPTKKRRGRKPSKKTESKSAEVVEEDERGQGDNADPSTNEDAAKLQGRDPLSKTSQDSTDVHDEALPDRDQLPEESVVFMGGEKRTTPSALEPTPSHEKIVATKTSTPPPKSSPSSHSPIKSSSGVPLRVGLSKRQRIPSLLRVMRPPVKR